MPKLNRSLMASMIEDIKEFIAVANEMCSWIGKVDHFSWRFPTRSARNVNAIAILEHHKGSAGEMYILLLEMAYDRLHFVLRLVVEFMDGYPFVGDLSKDVGKVKRPKNMSLANVIRTLWQRLKLVAETTTQNMVKTKHLEGSVFPRKKSCGTQASGSLSYCESCSNASRTVKEMTRIISTALRDSDLPSMILAEREVISPHYLFEKTQWAVMTKLVEATDTDVKTLTRTTSAIRAKNEADFKEHEKSLEKFLAEFEKQKIERESMEIKITQTRDQLLAVSSELDSLKDTRIELIEENRTLAESLSKTEEKFASLETLLAVTLQQMSGLAESKLALENEVKNLQDKRRSSIIETERLQTNSERLQAEKLSIENYFHEEMKILNQKHAEVVKNLEKDVRISATSFTDNFLTDVEVQETEERLNHGYGSVDILLGRSGDPEIDMSQQLSTNREAIKKLMGQNERLSRTLTRLKEHRRISSMKNDFS